MTNILVRHAVADLLERAPETWGALDMDTLSEPATNALTALVAAALVERRCQLQLRMFNHQTAVKTTITFTGEHGGIEALERTVASAWSDWQSAYDVWKVSEAGGVAPFLCERVGEEEWRLTSDGFLAIKDLRSTTRETVIDFVCRQGGYADRSSVRGRGVLVRLEKVPADAAPQADVRVAHWREGAEILAAALAPTAANAASVIAPGSGGPERDLKDDRLAKWFGKQIYLGRDTEVSRLFWLMATPVGRACHRTDMERTIDGSITTGFGTTDEAKKAWDRVRKAVSKLRERLREAALDTHVLIVRGGSNREPEYSMVLRFATKA